MVREKKKIKLSKVVVLMLALCIMLPIAAVASTATFMALASEPDVLTIVNTDEDGSKYPEHAGYLITGPGNTSVFAYTYDGIFTDSLAGWPHGTYTVTEFYPPDGYKRNTQVQKFEFDGNTVEPSTLTFRNEELEVLILKVLAKDGWKEDDDYEHELLPGTVFKITKPVVEMVPCDTAVVGLSAALFVPDYEDDTEIIATAEDGTLRIPLGGWRQGTYIVEEIVPPSGYKLDPAPQEFTISEGMVYPTELVFRNEPLIVEVRKLSTETGEHIPGAGFSVMKYNNSASVMEYGTRGHNDWYEYVFDVGDDPYMLNLGGWDTGMYIVTELWPPDGYALDSEPQFFEIVGDGTVTEEVLVFQNEPLTLLIEKRCAETGKLLPGAKFGIRRLEDIECVSMPIVFSINGLELITYSDVAGEDEDIDYGNDEETWDLIVTAVDGTHALNLAGWRGGTYVVAEIEPPKGYALSRSPQEFVIVGDGTLKPEVLTFENDSLELYIEKICAETHVVLSGAVFNIWGVDNGVNVNVFDEHGGVYVSLAGWEDGTYIVSEIKTPVGYLNDSEPQEFQILNGELSVYSMTFENHPDGTPIPQTGAEGLPVWVLPALVVLCAGALVVVLKIAKGKKR